MYDYDMITLPNGLRIVTQAMPSVRSAAVGIWVGVGSRFETAREAGSAHFIEHMLFKGTARHTAAQLAGEMDAIGGQCNAFTTRDNTCFYARVLDTHLDRAAQILSEMFFDSLFLDAHVQSERGVILEEIGMYLDTPEDLVVEELMASAFPGPLGRPVLGRPAALEAMTGASLRAFKEREYRPERIVVSLCGSFTRDNVRRLEERFSALEAVGRPNRRRTASYVPATALRRRKTEQNHFCLGWPGLAEGDPRRFAWQILSTVLGGGLSSRLFQSVREKHGLCYSIGSFTASYAETGLFGVSTAVSREAEKKALALIGEEVRRFLEDGLAPEELERARELMKSNLIMAMESTSSRMGRLGAAVLQLGRCPSAEEILRRYDAVTGEDVLALARDTLVRDRLSLSALGRLSPGEEYLSLLP